MGQSLGTGSSSSAAVENSKLLTESHAGSDSGGKIKYSKKLGVGEGDIKIDNDRLAKALQEERKRKSRGNDDGDRFDKKKKGPESGSHDVTEEELGLFFWLSVRVNSTYLAFIGRGVSNESPANGGSHGQLCGQGDLTPAVAYDINALYFIIQFYRHPLM